MRLPAEVARRGFQHVVGEHGGELRAHGPERPRHRRIHRAGAQVGAVELIDDPGQPPQLRPQHVGECVDRAEMIAFQLVPGVQAGGIPAERHALRLRSSDRFADSEVLAHVVKDELRAPRAAHRVGEGVDVPNRSLEVLGVMPRLVHELDEGDSGLVLERHARIRIHVIQDLAQVVHLRGDRRGLRAHPSLAKTPAEARLCGILQRVRPVRPVELDRAEEHVDAVLPRAGDEVVQEVQVVVGEQVAGAVGSLPVAPEGQPETVPTHPGELRHVLVDHRLAIGVEIPGCPIVGGGRQDVVRAEERDLPLVVLPANDALVVDVDGSIRPLGVSGAEKHGEHNEGENRRTGHYRADGTASGVVPLRTKIVTLASCKPSALAVRRSRPPWVARRITSPRPLNARRWSS